MYQCFNIFLLKKGDRLKLRQRSKLQALKAVRLTQLGYEERSTDSQILI